MLIFLPDCGIIVALLEIEGPEANAVGAGCAPEAAGDEFDAQVLPFSCDLGFKVDVHPLGPVFGRLILPGDTNGIPLVVWRGEIRVVDKARGAIDELIKAKFAGEADVESIGVYPGDGTKRALISEGKDRPVAGRVVKPATESALHNVRGGGKGQEDDAVGTALVSERGWARVEFVVL